jgi:hypothetical protein
MNQEVIPYDPNEEENPYKVATLADAYRVAKERSVDLEDPDPDPYGYIQEMEAGLNVDLIAPHWKAKPDDELWVKRFKARAKKETVARLLLQGHKVPAIARECQISEPTVIKYIGDVQREWRRSYLDDAELMAARDMDRLDYYLTRLADGIEAGDVKSINSAIEIVRVRANILGYAQGVQVDIESYVREVAEANGYDPDRAVALASRISVSYNR